MDKLRRGNMLCTLSLKLCFPSEIKGNDSISAHVIFYVYCPMLVPECPLLQQKTHLSNPSLLLPSYICDFIEEVCIEDSVVTRSGVIFEPPFYKTRFCCVDLLLMDSECLFVVSSLYPGKLRWKLELFCCCK